ncbi:MAG: trimethylamine methyltransferase family protein [Planctomycetes bacterium]|nr:trimethylamine methyltransferase family protein [Planctomycetota bacterium]
MPDHAGGIASSVFPAEQRERIHQMALRILRDVGIQVDDEDVQQRLRKAGAPAGDKPNRFRIPAPMVADALFSAPSTATIANRVGEPVAIGPEVPHAPSTFWTGAALRQVTGREGKTERIDSAWFSRFTRLVDRLPNTTAIVGTALSDVPPKVSDFVGFRLMAKNTAKHLRPLMFSKDGSRAILEMGRVLAGGTSLKERPILSVGYSILTPLRWEGIALGLFRQTAGHGIPVMINSEPMAGASAPVTLAGTVALGHAEVLSGVVINQLLEPGRPCIYNLGFAHVMEMHSSMALTGAPENGLLGAASGEMAAHVKLPSASWMCTEAMLADPQAAYEKTITALAHAQAGVGIIWGVGQLESEVSVSLPQAVIDDEIAGTVLRFKRGIPVDEERLAEKLIVAKGHDGFYLEEDHTVEHFRAEIRRASLSFRNRRETWEREGRADTVARAEARAQKLIGEAEAAGPRVSAEDDRELERIERHYRERLG